jgi:hypothetical protein
MSELAYPYASLNLAYSSVPEALQPKFLALIQAIEDHAAQQPHFNEILLTYMDTIEHLIDEGVPVQRNYFDDPLMATIALYRLYGRIPWKEASSRAHELRHFGGISRA